MGLTHFDSAAAYARWLKEFGPAQLSSGELFGVLPNASWGPGSGPAWEGAVSLIPWFVYEHTGDAGLLTNNYAAMKAYVNFETSVATNNIVFYGLGDPSPANTVTPTTVTDTTYYYQTALILAQTAWLMGNTADSTQYSNLAAQIKVSFNSVFYNSANSQYSGGTQTAQSCALNQGLANSNQITAVAGALATAVGQNNNLIDTGALGARALLRSTFADNGHADTAMALAIQTNYPSWGNQVLQGATTLWETFRNGTGTFDSHNHVYYGDISAWFMEYLAGIRPGSPGYQSVIIKPEITGAVAWAQATHNSPFGTISNAWQINGQGIALSLIIPPNSTGLVYLPTLGTAATNLMIQESGTNIWINGAPTGSVPMVAYNHTEGSGPQTYSVWNVSSGTYQFNWTIVPIPTGLGAQAGNGWVNLNWNPPGAASYKIKRSTVSGGPYSVLSSSVVSANYTDLTVTNGQTYYYVVSTVNAGVESINSSEVSASPARTFPIFSFETPLDFQLMPTLRLADPGASPAPVRTVRASSPTAAHFLIPMRRLGNRRPWSRSMEPFRKFYTVFAPGQTYTFTYSAAQRSSSSQSWNVTIDNAVIQSNSPGSTSYTTYTAGFVATATSHSLAFVGTDLAGGDNTVFIDNVRITPSIQARAASVTLTSPVNNASFLASSTLNLAATVVTNGGTISGVLFYSNATNLVGQSASTPYTPVPGPMFLREPTVWLRG